MAGVTPVYGFPYPHDTDPVNEGAKHIRDIAKQLESTFDQHDLPPADSELKDLVERLNRFEQMHSEDETIILPVGDAWEQRDADEIVLSRSGDVVSIWGTFRGGPDSGNEEIFTIPERHMPSMVGGSNLRWLMPGGSGRWTLRLNSNGVAERTMPEDAHSWHQVGMTYIVDKEIENE